MTLAAGTRVGSYEVLAKLGEGGMGEVYRARDTKLNRDVALKILPAAFATDPDRLARFKREALVLASLNHPNIAAVYGFEDSASTHALVLELVDGKDLSVLIQEGALGVAEVIPIARQLAEALETAHESGIIHRDLKPANIKVRDDGMVKVLDFGLAKALTQDSSSGTQDSQNSPTLTARATQMGMIIGTAAYMAPEQAKGKPVDKRADIWAFGAVLYEMLTGRRAFEGEDVSTTLAAVLMKAPEWTAMPVDAPPALKSLILRCLERDPKARLRDIGEARLVLGEPNNLRALPLQVTGSASGSAPRSRLAWLAIGVVSGVTLAVLGSLLLGTRAPAAGAAPIVGRFQLTVPADIQLSTRSDGSLSVSPDGRTLVFAAQKVSGGESQLWLRALDSTNVKALAGTEGGSQPFWSPDAGHIGFFAGEKLKQIDLRTGGVTTICDAPDPGGGTWNADGTIVFSPMIEGPMFRVSAGGGTPSQLTTLDAAELEANHMWPHFLPDGRHYLFQVLGLNNRGIYAGTLDGPARILVIGQDGFDMTAVQYSASGHLVYVRNHQLVARRFDVESLKVTGDEVAIADGFGIGGPGRPQFSVSRTGVLAFRPVGEPAIYQPTWYSRSGVQQGTLGAPGPWTSMEVSKDGRTLALDQFTEKESSTWLLDLARGTASRFTSDAYSVGPVWFPDGDRLAYVSVRDTPPNPFVRTMAGVETRLARLPKAVVLGSVTGDGATILGHYISPGTNDDIWLFPTKPNASPTVFLQTRYNEFNPRLSPDGRWVAYTSDENGTNEIYVTSFPSPGRRHRVSADVGTNARWSPDGTEILFRSRLRLMSAAFVASSPGEPSIGTPRLLFTLPEGTAPSWVFADNRFLFNVRISPRQSAPTTIVINWPAMARGQ